MMIMEKWKNIKGYDGRYLVSTMGRVKSNGGKRKLDKHIMSLRKQNSGYLVVNLWKDGERTTHTVHRLVLSTFTKEHEDMDVNHKNGDKKDNRLSNLEWCTRKENMEHAYRTGLRSDVRKVAAIDKGRVVAIGDFSRLLAEKLIPMYGWKGNSETVARNIRRVMDKDIKYHGLTFIEIKNL